MFLPAAERGMASGFSRSSSVTFQQVFLIQSIPGWTSLNKLSMRHLFFSFQSLMQISGSLHF